MKLTCSLLLAVSGLASCSTEEKSKTISRPTGPSSDAGAATQVGTTTRSDTLDSKENPAQPTPTPPNATQQGNGPAEAVMEQTAPGGNPPAVVGMMPVVPSVLPPGGMQNAPSGPPTSPLTFAKELTGWRWELPCKDPTARDTCGWDLSKVTGTVVTVPGFKLATRKVIKFGGDASKKYEVKVRVRGVSEPKTFDGGTVVGEHFQIGGTPQQNDYNRYTIEVAQPKETYTLNRSSKGVGHYTMVMDYEAKFLVQGQSDVTLGIYDPNTEAIANPGGSSNGTPQVVPGIAPAPQAFLGHLIQVDVLDVKLAP